MSNFNETQISAPDKKRIAMQIEMLNVEQLTPYAQNSRTHSAEQIAQIVASIAEFGFTNPVLIDNGGGIIAGHGRTMAAAQLGITQVPCIRLGHLNETQRRAYVIADNKLALNAGWDEAILAAELRALSDMDYDLALTGFVDDELSELLASLDATPTGATDPDAAPTPMEIATSRPGDVWLLGRHRVMCGDSTSIDQVTTLMAGAQADLLVTDPPYNVAYEGKTADALTIQNDEMDDSAFRQFLRDSYTAADAVMRPGAAFYIWHADSEGFNFRSAANEVNWRIRQCLVWVKNVLVMGRQDYHWRHEPCLYGWKEGAAHGWYSDRKQTTVLEFDKPQRNGEHPTMKPLALIRYQVENSSRAGHTVLDLFGGSGTTLMACEMSGRNNCSMELDPKYCDVIIRRWQDYTGGGATLESCGSTFAALTASGR